MAAAFNITAPSNELYLDADHAATAAAFTVTNISGALLRGHAEVALDGAGDAAWFTLQGSADRDFHAGEAAQYVVAVALPRTAPGGIYKFRIVMRSLTTGVSDSGPVIAVHVPDPVGPPPVTARSGYLATFLGAVAGDIVLLLAAAVGFSGWQGFGQVVMVLLGGAAGAYLGLRARQYDEAELTAGVLAGIQLVLSLLVLISPFLWLLVIALPPLPARAVALWRAGRFAWPWEPARPAPA